MTTLYISPSSPSRMKKLLNRSSVRWIALAALPMVAALSFFAVSQGSPPVIPLIALATEPLYAASTSDKPTLALALSVEYPTVGTQYRDGTYSNTKEFIGYYDAEACYIYNNNPSETPIAPLTAPAPAPARRPRRRPQSRQDQTSPTLTTPSRRNTPSTRSTGNGHTITKPASTCTASAGITQNRCSPTAWLDLKRLM